MGDPGTTCQSRRRGAAFVPFQGGVVLVFRPLVLSSHDEPFGPRQMVGRGARLGGRTRLLEEVPYLARGKEIGDLLLGADLTGNEAGEIPVLVQGGAAPFTFTEGGLGDQHRGGGAVLGSPEQDVIALPHERRGVGPQ